MKEMSDQEVIEFLLAGQVIFAHKAINAGIICPDEAADLLEMSVAHLLRLFDKLCLGRLEEDMTYEEMLDSRPLREEYFTAEDIKRLFLSDQGDNI